MFDKSFYPTPKPVIWEMLRGEDLKGAKILEPSAGKGDILDYIYNNKLDSRWADTKNDLYAIEKNTDLQQIIRGKGYNLISDDFLTYNPDYIFDYIIMNPPFDSGAKHLLKAWEIAKTAKIICLLNAETYYNPCTKEKQLLKQIIDDIGTVKDLGKCFRNAERRTNVDVILVTIKDEGAKSYFNFEGETKEERDFIEIEEYNDLAVKDDFGNLEINYNKCKEISKKIIQLQEKLKYYGKQFFTQPHQSNAVEVLKDSISNKPENTYNNFLESLRKHAWDSVISRTKVADLVTSNVRNDFYKTQNKQGFMAFTKENIEKFFSDLFLNQGAIAQNCVEEAFDIMTKYHKENRVHIEGWKTNDRWKVNKKVILPRMKSDWDNEAILDYRAKDQLADIEKAMCFLTKKTYTNIQSIENVFAENNKKADEKRNYFDCGMKFGEWYDSEFFEFKLFKKGTLHMKFKEQFVYEEFNRVACKNKNWIGN